MSKDTLAIRVAALSETQRTALADRLRSLSDSGAERLVAYYITEAGANPEPTEAELRRHAAERLPDYMAPARYVRLEDFPKTPNQKVDREALSRLTIDAEESSMAPGEPKTRLESRMRRLWSEVLGVDHVGLDHNFFELGGNSLLLIRLASRVHESFGAELPLSVVTAAPTISGVLAYLEDRQSSIHWPCLTTIREGDGKRPLFLVHGLGGGAFEYYPLASHLPADQAVYAFQAPYKPYDNLPDMARAYLAEARERQPEGPYLLGGFCLGAVVAFEMAQCLREAGQEVALLALIESAPPCAFEGNAKARLASFALRWRQFIRRRPSDQWAVLRDKAARLRSRISRSLTSLNGGFALEAEDSLNLDDYPEAYRDVVRVHFRALRDYKPRQYEGDAIVLRAEDDHWTRQDPTLGWGALVKGDLKIQSIEGDHHDTLLEPRVASLGAALTSALAMSRG